MSEAPLVAVEPGKCFARIFRCRAVLHRLKLLRHAHSVVLAQSKALRSLTQSDGDDLPSSAPSHGIPAAAQYRQACCSRPAGKAPRATTNFPALPSSVL